MGFLAHAISGHFGPHRSHELAKSIKLICPSGWSKERRCYASSNGLFAIGGKNEWASTYDGVIRGPVLRVTQRRASELARGIFASPT
jgi:hypothetical protein